MYSYNAYLNHINKVFFNNAHLYVQIWPTEPETRGEIGYNHGFNRYFVFTNSMVITDRVGLVSKENVKICQNLFDLPHKLAIRLVL